MVQIGINRMDEKVKERQDELIKFMTKYHVSNQKLAAYSGFTVVTIINYRTGEWEITDFKWGILVKAMQKIIEEQRGTDPKEVPYLVQDYMIPCLYNYERTLAMKKLISKRENEFLEELRTLGFECKLIDSGDDHWIVERTGRRKLQ